MGDVGAGGHVAAPGLRVWPELPLWAAGSASSLNSSVCVKADSRARTRLSAGQQLAAVHLRPGRTSGKDDAVEGILRSRTQVVCRH